MSCDLILRPIVVREWELRSLYALLRHLDVNEYIRNVLCYLGKKLPGNPDRLGQSVFVVDHEIQGHYLIDPIGNLNVNFTSF